ncbi:sodium-dependent glucose transporter 1-like [Ruditapes philippinarum]|uniref:sodium-dependent glucose transporter 1-like n=1 Tax=Ruditapes philippinarum TaxID=129788 RepID=UPI00295B0EF5|nr:sodium-dependent glucose transporter 1-like [Ruditapes philippinarum]
MLGSLVGGILYDRFNQVLMIAISTVVLSVFTGVTPWCTWFPAMMMVTFMSGFGSGWLDTGGNVNIISLWDTEGGSYMQALHLSFGLGGILSPLATEPFLAKPACSQPVQGNTNNSGTSFSVTLFDAKIKVNLNEIEF